MTKRFVLCVCFQCVYDERKYEQKQEYTLLPSVFFNKPPKLRAFTKFFSNGKSTQQKKLMNQKVSRSIESETTLFFSVVLQNSKRAKKALLSRNWKMGFWENEIKEDETKKHLLILTRVIKISYRVWLHIYTYFTTIIKILKFHF